VLEAIRRERAAREQHNSESRAPEPMADPQASSTVIQR
jgi:hypothetical protein